MADAYLDLGHVVVAWNVVNAICVELGADPLKDFGLKPLYKGEGTRDAVAWECSACGAPIGGNDPDECRWVAVGKCAECRGMEL